MPACTVHKTDPNRMLRTENASGLPDLSIREPTDRNETLKAAVGVGGWELTAERKADWRGDHGHVPRRLPPFVAHEMSMSGVYVTLPWIEQFWRARRVVGLVHSQNALDHGDEHRPRVRMPPCGSADGIVVCSHQYVHCGLCLGFEF